MTTSTEYYALINELEAIEKTIGTPAQPKWLADEICDQENSDHCEYNTPEFWAAMYRSACSAAGGRAEEYGLNINTLIGRVIY
jgi:hypothetical protein